MTPEQEARYSRPLTLTEDEVQLLFQYNSGQESKIYAAASSNGLRRGTLMPSDCDNDVEWMRRLLAGFETELQQCLALAKKTNLENDVATLRRILKRTQFRLRQIEDVSNEKDAQALEQLAESFKCSREERLALQRYYDLEKPLLGSLIHDGGLQFGVFSVIDERVLDWVEELLGRLSEELAAIEATPESVPVIQSLQKRIRTHAKTIEAAVVRQQRRSIYKQDLDIEEVLEHYIAAALWTNEEELRIPQDLRDGDMSHTTYGRNDLMESAVEKMRADVTRFVNENHAALSTWCGQGGTSIEQQAGHDFWLTRNDHGCGFWESEWGDVGASLTKAAKGFGTVDLCVEDGQIDIC